MWFLNILLFLKPVRLSNVKKLGIVSPYCPSHMKIQMIEVSGSRFWSTLGLAICFLTLPVQSETVTKSGKVPNFSEDVAPIVFQNCVGCHRPGEAAPFSLLSYKDVQKHGKLITEVTGTRFMPPWHAEQGHIELLNPRMLSADQIALFKTWYENGMPEGNPGKLPKLPTFVEGWQLGKPDLVVKMEQPWKLYAEGRDIYRNFVFPLNFTEDKWVRAIEFRPCARTVVHHALFFIDTTGTARKMDEEDAEPGFKGGDRASRTFKPVGGWALGGNPRPLPDGLAIAYPKGSDLVIQTHFHPAGKEEEETSTVGLYFADAPPKQTFVGIQLPPAFGEITGMDIPAGETNYLVKNSFTLPIDVEAFAISSHAHYLGKVMTMTAVLPDGKEKLLLKIPDWDFAWQEQYTFKNRVPLPKGTRLDVVMSYDNSANNPKNPANPPVRVRWGPRSNDEMGSIGLQVVAAKETEAPILRAGLKDHVTDILIDRAIKEPKRIALVDALFKQFDKNENGKIDDDERPALRTFIQNSPIFPPQLNNTF
ncbi:MAG: hypothetical protein JWN25_1203 [Verrucomicrobiales bacterium]|nr:hypothetical protein [Verrucomicrobiales bacterium]